MIRTLLIMLAVVSMLFWSGGCSRTGRSPAPATKPFRASAEREAEILGGLAAVKSGMTITDVERLMGSPNRVLPLYEPVIENPERLGTTSWYVIEDDGESVEDLKAVRVSFNLGGRVTAIDRLGLDDRPTAH